MVQLDCISVDDVESTTVGLLQTFSAKETRPAKRTTIVSCISPLGGYDIKGQVLNGPRMNRNSKTMGQATTLTSLFVVHDRVGVIA
jgi:hypothetical protein